MSVYKSQERIWGRYNPSAWEASTLPNDAIARKAPILVNFVNLTQYIPQISWSN